MKLELNTDGKTMTLPVPGDLISTNVETIRHEANALFGTDASKPPEWNIFTLDLTSAKMVDSAGLNLIVSLFKRAQQHGRKIQILYSNPNILRTIAFTRLDKHVEMVKV